MFESYNKQGYYFGRRGWAEFSVWSFAVQYGARYFLAFVSVCG